MRTPLVAWPSPHSRRIHTLGGDARGASCRCGEKRGRVPIDESVHLSASVCVSALATMDFTAEVTADVEGGGELELF